MKTPKSTPPPHLSARAKQLWAALVPHQSRSPARLALLQTALEALDRANQARLLITRQGLTTVTKTTGAVHLNPLLKVERENRQLFTKIRCELSLEWDREIDG